MAPPPSQGRTVHVLVAVVAVAAAVGAATADGAATGWEPLDLVLRALLAALLCLAASRQIGATWWMVSVAALVGVLLSSPMAALAAAGFGVLVATKAAARPDPVLSAVAAGLAVQTLLRLEWPLATGLPTLVVLAATIPLLVAGYRGLEGAPRQRARWVLIGVGVYCALASLAGLAAALSARSNVERALDSGLSGLDAIGGDRQSSEDALAIARDEFAEASDTLGAPWARPALAVPFVAQQLRAAHTMADTGAELSDQALDTLVAVDPADLSPREGRVDLAALEAAHQPLVDAAAALERADRRLEAVGSPFLVETLAGPHEELTDRIDQTMATADLAARAAELAPEMLGADGPRRYLLLVQTPVESRGTGGFQGNWGQIDAVDGSLDLTILGRIGELNEAQAPEVQLEGLDDLRAQWGDERLATWGANNFTPDFPTVAELAAQLYPQSDRPPIDAVIAVDPYGLAALLEAVGRVRVDGWPDPITKNNATRILLHDQYTTFLEEGSRGRRGDESDDTDDPQGAGNEARKDFVGDVAEAAFDKLVDGGFETPSQLIDAMAPAVEGRHLQIVGLDEPTAGLFEAMGATGATPPLLGDSVGVVGQNFAGNKIDWFLRRSSTYDVAWDPATGQIDGELEIRLRNEAPDEGLPQVVIGYGGNFSGSQTPTAPGENLMLLSVHSAFPVTSLTLDGEPIGATAARDHDRYVYTFYVSVPSKSERVVQATTSGSIGAHPYRFDPVWQPVVEPDALDVTVQVGDGWRIGETTGDRRGEQTAVVSWALDRNRSLFVEAERPGTDLFRRLRGDD